MNAPILRFSRLLIAGLFAAIVTTSFAEEPAATLYNRKTGLMAGWSSVVWGNLTIAPSKTVVKETGGSSLWVMPMASASAYAGLQIVAEGGGDIPLSDALRKSGEVHLYLRNGTDLAGQPGLDQSLQVMLAFQPKGGEAINGKYESIVLAPAAGDAKTPAGWQRVTLSIPSQLQGRVDPATPVKLHGVYVQYIDLPAAGYFVGECTVVAKPAK
jgi:hypothetical protein